MSLHEMRVAILVEDQYQDQEVWYPYYRLKEEGVEVLIVGTNKKEYKSKHGYPVMANVTIDKVSTKQFHAVIIPGGYAPDILRRYPDVIRFVKEMNDQGKLIAAICHAGWVLCSANVLRGKTVTCFFAIKDDVVNAGAKYVDREVVQDGNLLTARKPDDLPAFMRAFIQSLSASQAPASSRAAKSSVAPSR